MKIFPHYSLVVVSYANKDEKERIVKALNGLLNHKNPTKEGKMNLPSLMETLDSVEEKIENPLSPLPKITKKAIELLTLGVDSNVLAKDMNKGLSKLSIVLPLTIQTLKAHYVKDDLTSLVGVYEKDMENHYWMMEKPKALISRLKDVYEELYKGISLQEGEEIGPLNSVKEICDKGFNNFITVFHQGMRRGKEGGFHFYNKDVPTPLRALIENQYRKEKLSPYLRPETIPYFSYLRIHLLPEEPIEIELPKKSKKSKSIELDLSNDPPQTVSLPFETFYHESLNQVESAITVLENVANILRESNTQQGTEEGLLEALKGMEKMAEGFSILNIMGDITSEKE